MNSPVELNTILEFLDEKGISEAILLLTAFILFVYTTVTYLLWRESKRQTALQTTPWLWLYLKESPTEYDLMDPERTLYLKNIGKGPATKIHIEGLTLFLTGIGDVYEFKFDRIELLEAGAEMEIKFKQGLISMFFEAYYSGRESGHKSPFHVKYKDILGNSFFLKVRLDEKGYRIVSHGRDRWLPWLFREAYSKIKNTRLRIIAWFQRKKNAKRRAK